MSSRHRNLEPYREVARNNIDQLSWYIEDSVKSILTSYFPQWFECQHYQSFWLLCPQDPITRSINMDCITNSFQKVLAFEPTCANAWWITFSLSITQTTKFHNSKRKQVISHVKRCWRQMAQTCPTNFQNRTQPRSLSGIKDWPRTFQSGQLREIQEQFYCAHEWRAAKEESYCSL